MKSILAYLICFFVLLNIANYDKNSLLGDNTKNSATTNQMQNDEKLENLLTEIEKPDFDRFCFSGYIHNKYYKTLSNLDEFYRSDWKKLVELYPRMSFFRVLRYYVLEDETKFIDSIADNLTEIITEVLSTEVNDRVTLEKADLCILLAARFPKLFNNLVFDTKKTMIYHCFKYPENLSVDYDYRFKNAFLENNDDVCVEIIMNILVNDETKYLFENTEKKEDYIGDIMLRYAFENYNTKYKDLFFKLYDINKTKKGEIPEDIVHMLEMLSDDLLSNNDDFFIKYFLTNHTDFWFLSLDATAFDNINKTHIVLTYKKYEYLYKLYKEISINNNATIDLLRRILCYVSYENEFECKDSTNPFKNEKNNYFVYIPDKYIVQEYNEINEIKKLKTYLKKSFRNIEDNCFVEYKSQFIIKDEDVKFYYVDDKVTEKIETAKFRKIFKWSPTQNGYGSPTYSSDCFLNWEKHKSQYPEYENLRRQYLEFNKKYLDN